MDDIYIFKFHSSLFIRGCGVLNINVELGRFDNTLREQRIYPVCKMNAIENEYHFILLCQKEILKEILLYVAFD